jgi:hypothetical protein
MALQTNFFRTRLDFSNSRKSLGSIGYGMKANEEIFASWSELAVRDLLTDVAAVVDATQSDRVWNDGNNPGKSAVLRDEGN